MWIKRGQDGAVAVEFALVLPVLMILMLGIVEFSYAFLMQASVANAARIGARSYAINYTTETATKLTQTQLQQAAIDIAKNATPTPADVVAGTFSSVCAPLAQTTLTLPYRYHSLTGWFDGILGQSVTLKGIGSMQCGG